jgi:hypothetical protein
MSHKYSINEILEAVHTLNPQKKSNKKYANEEILDAVKEIYDSEKPKQILTPEKIQIVPNNINLNNEIKTKTKVEKKEKVFTTPLMLTNIIKFEPIKSKALFLKKLHNSNLKIITMKISTQVNK